MKKKKILLVGEMPPAKGGIAFVCSMIISSKFLNEYYEFSTFDAARKAVYSNREKNKFTISGIVRRIRLLFQILKKIIKERPTIVHYHSVGDMSFISDFLNILAIKLTLRKVILHYHNDPTNTQFISFPSKTSFFRRTIFLFSLRLIELTLVLSEKYKKYLVEIYGDWVARKIGVQINSTTITAVQTDFSDVRAINTKPVILYMGKLSQNKGFFDLIELARLCSCANLDVSFKVAGAFNSFEEEQTIRNRLSLMNFSNIELLGEVEGNAKIELLQKSDLLIFPSRFEAFPITVLEAAAFEIPAIVYKTGILNELVIDGISGFVLSMGDIAEMFRKVEYFTNNRDSLRKYGVAARNLFDQKYSVGRFEESLQNHYFTVINGYV